MPSKLQAVFLEPQASSVDFPYGAGPNPNLFADGGAGRFTLLDAHRYDIGVAVHDSAGGTGASFIVMRHGIVRDVSGSGWTVGETLWADPNGFPTNVRPAATHVRVKLGTVFYAAGGEGPFSVLVDVKVFPPLGEMSGVDLTSNAPVERELLFVSDVGSGILGFQNRKLDHGLDPEATSLLDPEDHPMLQRKHGFSVNSDGSEQVEITYDEATRKITLTPWDADFRFYIDGHEHIKAAPEESPAHDAVTGKHFFFYDEFGTLQVSQTPWSIRDRTVTPVALVYWDDSQSDGWAFYECHTADRTLEQHYHDHFTQGTKFIRGGALTGYTLTTDTDAGITFEIAPVTLADEDIVRETDGLADAGPYMILWRTGAAGEWTWDDTRAVPHVSAAASYVQYNDPNGGGAGVWGLTSAGANNYAVYYLLATTSIQGLRQHFLIPDQTFTGSLSAAQARTLSQLDLGTLPFEEFVPLYKIIFRTGAGYGSTGKCRIEEIASIMGTVTATITGSAPSNVHNALSGLQGGGALERFHLTEAERDIAVLDPVISRGGTAVASAGLSAGGNFHVWVAPYDCEVIAVKGIRSGGTGATINARRNGSSDHLASALSLTSADTWLDGGAVQNVAYTTGDRLEIMVVTVAGSPTQVGVQVDFRRT